MHGVMRGRGGDHDACRVVGVESRDCLRAARLRAALASGFTVVTMAASTHSFRREACGVRRGTVGESRSEEASGPGMRRERRSGTAGQRRRVDGAVTAGALPASSSPRGAGEPASLSLPWQRRCSGNTASRERRRRTVRRRGTAARTFVGRWDRVDVAVVSERANNAEESSQRAEESVKRTSGNPAKMSRPQLASSTRQLAMRIVLYHQAHQKKAVRPVAPVPDNNNNFAIAFRVHQLPPLRFSVSVGKVRFGKSVRSTYVHDCCVCGFNVSEGWVHNGFW
ncbi:hypothetical protein C8R45DRAFT_1080773 [Mycena sanguinolenta]|nr:hypothetical protein C8R45DRAFT_1080773 [Mycena sanguinolenta]